MVGKGGSVWISREQNQRASGVPQFGEQSRISRIDRRIAGLEISAIHDDRKCDEHSRERLFARGAGHTPTI
jgi:hypothetical protein